MVRKRELNRWRDQYSPRLFWNPYATYSCA